MQNLPISVEKSEQIQSTEQINDPKNIQKNITKLAEATDEIVSATGQAFYVWDIASDTIEWSRNFANLVGLDENETKHLKGRSFESMLGSQSKETRFGAIISVDQANKSQQSVPYQCVYLFQPNSSKEAKPLWIEDTGCWFPDETGRPMRAEGTIRIINDRRQREEDLRRQSDFDDLTGLPNRRSLEKHIQKTIANFANDGIVSTFMILSLDRMDLINDIYGFATGDFILKKVGEIICGKLRADDIICRFSGAKFGIVLKDCPPAEVYDAGNRLLKAISADVIKTPKGMISISGVIGACFLPRHGETPKAAIHAAFKATRNARYEVARRVSVFSESPEQQAAYSKKAEFSVDVIKAIEENRIHLVYQPVCRSDGSIAFHEALVRMENPGGSINEASSFVGTAEELGLIRVVDKYALNLVLDTLKNYPSAVLSVNVSQDTVLDPQWISTLAGSLALIPNGAARLIVEITESMAVVNINETKRFLENVKTLGCRTAIDDFGAGFTSFANLKQLPVDIIKIDGAFGVNLIDSKENQGFIKALLALAKVFNIKTVVEWVEDHSTSQILASWNVDYQQGHQFGRPIKTAPWARKPAD